MADENPITLTAYVEGGIKPRARFTCAHELAPPSKIPAVVNRLLDGNRFQPPIDLFMGYRSWSPDVAAWLALDIDPRMVERYPMLQTAAVRDLVRLVEDAIRQRIGEQAPPQECVEVIRGLGMTPPWMKSLPTTPSNECAEMIDDQAGIDMHEVEPPYSTPMLDIQREAIALFFNPRREIDPKQYVVVDWIQARMKDAGLPPSNSMARAIFTIIKPIDHSPRKRKG